MTAEVLELGFLGQEGGEVGERQRELQGKDTNGETWGVNGKWRGLAGA